MQLNASTANPRETNSRGGDRQTFPWARASSVFIFPAFVSLVLDRVTKILAERTLAYSAPEEVLGQYLRLVLWYNHGAAFGLSFGGKWVHVVLSLVAMGVVAYLVWRTPREHSAMLVGFALILGGAAGNLWDRLVAGKVTDFIDVGIGSLRWPTFNVADASVVVGVALILMASYQTDHAEKAGEVATEDPSPATSPERNPSP